VSTKRVETVLAMMASIEAFSLTRAWTGLGNDEFFWEPVAGAWSVRRREECWSATPFGNGDWVADFDDEQSVAAQLHGQVEPLTTIGWLLWHIGSLPHRLAQLDFLGGNRTLASGWTSPYLSEHRIFSQASEATETLRTGWDDLRVALERVDDEQLEQPVAQYTYASAPRRGGLLALGPPGPTLPAFSPVASALNEIGHHATQICVLRDLHRWTAWSSSGTRQRFPNLVGGCCDSILMKLDAFERTTVAES
jgi:hypothetical protein